MSGTVKDHPLFPPLVEYLDAEFNRKIYVEIVRFLVDHKLDRLVSPAFTLDGRKVQFLAREQGNRRLLEFPLLGVTEGRVVRHARSLYGSGPVARIFSRYLKGNLVGKVTEEAFLEWIVRVARQSRRGRAKKGGR